VDSCIATDSGNLQRTASLLYNLGAKLLRVPGRGVASINMNDWTTLRLADPSEHHLFSTPFGNLDILPQPFGPGGWGTTTDYAQLAPNAVTTTVFGLKIQVAAFAAIAASKLAIGRPQDVAAGDELQRVDSLLKQGKKPDYGLEQYHTELRRGDLP
jgi:hypothetical protein